MNRKSSFDFLNVLRDISLDEAKSKTGLNLTAYENCISKTCTSFLDSPLNERYHLDTIEQRDKDDEVVTMSGGLSRMSMKGVSALETLAVRTANKIFSAEHVEMRPLSGIHAMICVICTLTVPGDTILSVSPQYGGHHATSNLVKLLGRKSEFVSWLEEENNIDVAETINLCKRGKPSMILLDLGATLFPLPVSNLRLLGPKGIIIAYDGSHILGLVCGAKFPNPLALGADVLFGNCHKTFPGPQKGIILFKSKELGLRVSKEIGETLVSSQHTGDTIALYLALLEMEEFGVSYASAVVKNATVLAKELDAVGIESVKFNSVATESGAFWIKPPRDMENHEACRRLAASGIFINARSLNGENLIRIGTQYVTRQGMNTPDMQIIAGYFSKVLVRFEKSETVRGEIEQFLSNFKEVKYCFDTLYT